MEKKKKLKKTQKTKVGMLEPNTTDVNASHYCTGHTQKAEKHTVYQMKC